MRASVSIHHGHAEGDRWFAVCLLCAVSFLYAAADQDTLAEWFASHLLDHHRMGRTQAHALASRVLAVRRVR